MSSSRTYLVATTCALLLPLAACGGGDGGEETIIPEGTHYGYVVSKVSVVPPPGKRPTDYGLDLGSPTSPKLDGTVDNQLGITLATLAGFFNAQTAIDTAVNQGDILLLVDFQTEDFTTSAAAGLSVKFGANPNPAACSDPADTVCGKHLAGNASFTIDPSSPQDAALGGKIAGGTFTSTAGDISLQLTLGGVQPVALNLLHARTRATGISDTGIMSANVGGLLTVEDLNTKIAPAIQTEITSLVARDCTPGAAPPGCGCPAGSTGALIIGQLDKGVMDCMISVDEILNYELVKVLLKPDSCSKDSCAAPDALSVGVQIQAVKATFSL